jgi:uncharacterized protein YndB with AHSA1/START domain
MFVLEKQKLSTNFNAMETIAKTNITIETLVNAPIEKVWAFWIEPKHIVQWCNASDDWHAPHAENDLRNDGKFKTTMAAKDGSVSFDFEGIYTNVQPYKVIEYTIGDGRKVVINFLAENANQVKVVETFEAENIHPVDMQRDGWQSILNNFKKHVESNE